MGEKDIYNFYMETSFLKTFLWVVFTVIWIIMTFLITGAGTGWFDAVIERTNIYFFYIFWLGVSIILYLLLYFKVYKKGKSVLRAFGLCFLSVILLLGLSYSSVKIAASSYKTFSIDEWKECKNVRKYMIYDLINNNDIIGMEVDDAIKLLGEPDSYYNSQISNSKGIVYLSGRNTYIITFWLKNGKIDGYTVG